MHLNQRVSDIRLRINRRSERKALEKAGAGSLASVASASAYSGLNRYSERFARITLNERAEPSVNLVLPELTAVSIFAGIRTSIEFAVAVAAAGNRRLRILTFSGPFSPKDREAVDNLLSREFNLAPSQWEFVGARELSSCEFNSRDVWIPTYWTTAHALDVSCRLGILNPSQVIYLIQDFEPSFLPASTDSFLAVSTYRAGFVPIVNSAPLASALQKNLGLNIPVSQVFAPQLDMGRLQEVAKRRETIPVSRQILFYGRPSKPRNMYNLGVAALRRAVELGAADDWTFISVGEPHGKVRLGNQIDMSSVGSLSWSAYFELLGKAPIMLSLQASPHPSHPPLDMVSSGGFAVTNEVDRSRHGLHRNLLVAEADPDALAIRLIECMEFVAAKGHPPQDETYISSKLGVSMDDAAKEAAALTGLRSAWG